MAAICMLLVSSIMMVSSTYAWFTLSTAPEVTGIQTAVGANGNLEMALLPTTGATADIKSEVGDSMSVKDVTASNITWGNLVDLQDTTAYGLDKIMLYPSALNADATGKLTGALLNTPVYGADGRVSELDDNTVTGVYNQGKFVSDSKYGVRAVGVASGMTDRQLDYRNAGAAAATAAKQAQNTIITSLTGNGKNLANIAVKHGLGDAATESYDAIEMGYMETAVADLKTALGYIEDAYLQYILTYAASAATGEEDDVEYLAVKALVEAENATFAGVVGALKTNGVTITGIDDVLSNYNDLVEKIALAESKIPTGDAKNGVYTWTEISAVMTPLMNTDLMTVNGYTIAQVKADKQLLIDAYTATGRVTLTMVSGSGVYADIADQVGDYSAGFKMTVEYNGLTLRDVPAAMQTESALNTPYVEEFGAVAKNAGAPTGTSTENPISEFYGFVIDLAFRTNAANSNLMLQQDAVDRIYSGNTNEATMGHGSSMTFKATDLSFTNEQMLGLMDAIRVVFFNPDDGTLVARAKLDTAAGKYTVGTDGITAKLSLCTEIGDVTYNYSLYDSTVDTTYITDGGKLYNQVENKTYSLITEADGEVTTKYAWDATANEGAGGYVESPDGTYKMTVSYTYEEAENGLYKRTEVKSETATLLADQTIMALTQNTAHALSALVYLDGNKMSNEDVAIGASSMTGSLNLQFSSDATLVPMEYAALHQPAGGNDATTEEETTGDEQG